MSIAHTVSFSTSLRRASARLSLAACATTLVALAGLHAIRPDLDPSWRVISEYARGASGPLLAVMFVAWGVSSWSLAAALAPRLDGLLGRSGLVLLAIAGLGQAAAAPFPIDHPLHDVTAVLGGLGLPSAALFVSLRLRRDPAFADVGQRLLGAAGLTWLGELAMVGSLVLLFQTYVAAGGDPNANGERLTELPAGTIAVVGYANRFLVVAYVGWTALVAHHAARRI